MNLVHGRSNVHNKDAVRIADPIKIRIILFVDCFENLQPMAVMTLIQGLLG